MSLPFLNVISFIKSIPEDVLIALTNTFVKNKAGLHRRNQKQVIWSQTPIWETFWVEKSFGIPWKSNKDNFLIIFKVHKHFELKCIHRVRVLWPSGLKPCVERENKQIPKASSLAPCRPLEAIRRFWVML